MIRYAFCSHLPAPPTLHSSAAVTSLFSTNCSLWTDTAVSAHPRQHAPEMGVPVKITICTGACPLMLFKHPTDLGLQPETHRGRLGVKHFVFDFLPAPHFQLRLPELELAQWARHWLQSLYMRLQSRRRGDRSSAVVSGRFGWEEEDHCRSLPERQVLLNQIFIFK